MIQLENRHHILNILTPTKMNKQQLPEWFKGMTYEEGEEVTNPFTGDVFELNNLELSMYDYIMGSYYIFEMAPKTVTEKNVEELQEALKWFRETNLEAYKTLLD